MLLESNSKNTDPRECQENQPMRKHASFATHPTAAPTIPAVTIGLDLSDKTAHWCAVDQAGNVSGRGQLRLTHAELRKHFTAVPRRASPWRPAASRLGSPTS